MASAPPNIRDVLSQIGDYLQDVGYTKSLRALTSEAQKHGVAVDVDAWANLGASPNDHAKPTKLLAFWDIARTSAGHPTLDPSSVDEDSQSDSESEDSESEEEEANEGGLLDIAAKEESDDSSDSDSDSSGRPSQKRKRALTPDSSSDSSSDSAPDPDNAMAQDRDSSTSDSDSGSSSIEGEQRPLKRAKLSDIKKSHPKHQSSSDSDSDSSASDSSSSDSEPEPARHSDSDSAAKDSSSGSDSSSDSESDSSKSPSPPPPPPPPTKKAKKSKPSVAKSSKPALSVPSNVRTGSATSSSATLPLDSPGIPLSDGHGDAVDTLVIEDAEGPKQVAATKENIRKLKKEQVPFSRIPTNQAVDPRFSSNAYVPYEYADRAYRDLVVTKGKGFTKEKNKKKRGAYRGGPIDTTPKAIKFDD